MMYIKPFFESISYINELVNDRDEIIQVLTNYCKLYADSTTEKIWEIIWDFVDEDIDLESLDIITSEVITNMVDNLIRSSRERECRVLIELYYDCCGSMENDNSEVIENIKDIFSDYLDDKKVGSFYKTSDKSDNRYVIEIKKENIMTSIDFNEIMGRIDDFVKVDGFDYYGNRNFIKFEFYFLNSNNEY